MTKEDLEIRAATLLARMWNEMGRFTDFEVKIAEQTPEMLLNREMRCVVILKPDEFAPTWHQMDDHGHRWVLASRNSEGEIEWRIGQRKAEVVRAAEASKWALWAYVTSFGHGTCGSLLEAQVAALETLEK